LSLAASKSLLSGWQKKLEKQNEIFKAEEFLRRTNNFRPSSSLLFGTFRCFENAIFARLYPLVGDDFSCSRNPQPKQFAYCRGPAWHSVIEPERVDHSKLLGRQHNLQAFSPG
jgi:hypothetical protein